MLDGDFTQAEIEAIMNGFKVPKVEEQKHDILNVGMSCVLSFTWSMIKYCIYFSALAIVCLTIFGIVIALA